MPLLDQMSKAQKQSLILTIAVVVAAITCYAWYTSGNPPVKETIDSKQPDASQDQIAEVPEPTYQMMVVDVVGAVVREGPVEVPPGSRVVDAITKAGGLAPNADRERVNLAQKLVDGQQVIVPAIGEQTEQIQGVQVSLNTATAQELANLPGIGEALAERIIEYRLQIGGYRQLEQVMNVQGISQSLFDEIKKYLTL